MPDTPHLQMRRVLARVKWLAERGRLEAGVSLARDEWESALAADDDQGARDAETAVAVWRGRLARHLRREPTLG